MIEQEAVVVSSEQEFVLVQTMQQTSCGQCSVNKGCGTALLSEVFENRRQPLSVLNTLSVKAGDRVIVGLEEQALLKGSMAVYMLPLVFMFVMGLLGETLSEQLLLSSEILTVTLALVGLAFGGMWLRYFSLKVKYDARYQPVLLRQI